MPRQNLNGNILYNGNFEIAPAFTAATTSSNKWIDGAAAGNSALISYGWAVINGALTATASAQFDSSVSHSGSNSLKLATGDATGAITCGTYIGTSPTLQTAFVLLPSTSYTLTAWIKTNNVASNAVFIDFRQYSAAIATLATTSSTKLSGTNDWTQVTITVTTNASAALGSVLLRNNVAGNIGQAWFDDIVITPTAAVTRTLA